jgi:hypothetical protein
MNARHVRVTISVSDDDVELISVSVDSGVAPAHAAAGPFAVRVFNRDGFEIDQFTVRDPLAIEVHPSTDGSVRSGEASPVDRHPTPFVERAPRADVDVILRLDPQLQAIDVGWNERARRAYDIGPAIRQSCAADDHPDCLAWLAANPE